MAVSFYKMFGYPTGVGALVARKSFLAKLHKPYFSGGTVEVVQCPGTIVHESSVQYERFEVRIFLELSVELSAEYLTLATGWHPKLHNTTGYS